MSATPVSATIALVGNPNAGKTTLFNALTGENQRVGNYSGVTVELKTGTFFTPHGRKLRLLDLPGCYSLRAASPDEQVAVDALTGALPGESKPAPGTAREATIWNSTRLSTSALIDRAHG